MGYLVCAGLLGCCVGFFWKKHRAFILTFGFLLGLWRPYITKEHGLLPNLNPVRDNLVAYRGYADQRPYKKGKHYRFRFVMDRVYDGEKMRPAHGSVLVYVRQNPKFLNYGDELWIRGLPRPIPEPSSEYAFDYKHYMARKGVFFQDFVPISTLSRTGRWRGSWLKKWAYTFRVDIISTFDKHLSPSASAMLKGFVLGVRRQLAPSVEHAFASAGLMHLLAVSGLHVGILYGLMTLLFSFLPNYRGLQLTRHAIILVLLWFFALLTGMTSSVVRAATMFSFWHLSHLFFRQSHLLYRTCLAAFFMLLLNPSDIFSMGFQLSFLAITGIALGFELWPAFWQQKGQGLTSWLWIRTKQLVVISLLAQGATLPLTLHYFHIFPTYFLASNLVISPLLLIILPGGLLLYAVDQGFPPLAHITGQVMDMLLACVENILLWIDTMPYARLYPLYLDSGQVLAAYVGLLMMGLWKVERRNRYVWGACVSVACIVLLEGYRAYEARTEEQVLVQNIGKGWILEYRHKGKLMRYEDERVEEREKRFHLHPRYIKSGLWTLSEQHTETLPVVSYFGGKVKSVRIRDECWVIFHVIPPFDEKFYSKMLAQANYLIFSRGAIPYDKDLFCFLSKKALKKVIIASRRRASGLERWRKRCEEEGISVHDVVREGIFIRRF